MANLVKFVCQECGFESSEYLGKCPECGVWNSLKKISVPSQKESKQKNIKKSLPKTIRSISLKEDKRVSTGFDQVDAVLGGGLTLGSVNLLAGDPGVGKSTLLLQVALQIADSIPSKKVLYISSEESEIQVTQRLMRLKRKNNSDNILILSTVDTDNLVEQIRLVSPGFVVIDSIQTISSQAISGLSGSLPQIRYAAFEIINLCKTLNIPVVIVGHVTKEGLVAGPMVLSHMVDAVLFLEGEKESPTRVLRSFKNRFGSLDEVGIFLMDSKGLRGMENPEEFFLTDKSFYSAGAVPVVILEGSRPFLLEIQALAVFSKLTIPRRVVWGFDARRLELLLAVLKKHCGLAVDIMDIFVNVAGGFKVSDRACDLAVCLAIFSSIKNKPLGKIIGLAEVGLLGELRKVSALDKRIKEGERMGFKKIITPSSHRFLKDVLLQMK